MGGIASATRQKYQFAGVFEWLKHVPRNRPAKWSTDRQVLMPAVSVAAWVTTPANTFGDQPKRVYALEPIAAVLCDEKKDGWHLSRSSRPSPNSSAREKGPPLRHGKNSTDGKAGARMSRVIGATHLMTDLLGATHLTSIPSRSVRILRGWNRFGNPPEVPIRRKKKVGGTYLMARPGHGCDGK